MLKTVKYTHGKQQDYSRLCVRDLSNIFTLIQYLGRSFTNIFSVLTGCGISGAAAPT